MKNKFNEREYKILKEVKSRAQEAYIKEQMDQTFDITKKVYLSKVRPIIRAHKEKQSVVRELV